MHRLVLLLVLAAVGDATGHVDEPSCPVGRGEECANQGSLSDDHVALLQTRATMHSSAAHSEAPEERTLNITFDNEDEAHQAGLKIVQAFKDAGLNINEWEVVAESDDSDGESAHSDGNRTMTFPMVMPYRVRHIPAPPSGSELIETDDESLQAALDQEQEGYQAVSNNTEYKAVSDEEMEVYLNMEVYNEKKAQKNKKQKAWAAKAISKLQGEVCKRDYMNKYAAYAPRSALIWCWESCWTGMDKHGCICYDPCPSGWHHVLGFCSWSCPSQWTDDGTTCTEWCSVPGLEHLNTHCGISYCADSDGSCVAKVAKISMAFIDMMANFVPGGKAMTGLKKAAQKGTKLAIKTAIKAAAKEVAKKLMKKAKKNLYKYMKAERKELQDELKDSILEGGIEEVTEVMIAKTQTGALKDAAVEMIKAVDPTGIADVVDAFQADGCEDKKITPMPEDGIEDEDHCGGVFWAYCNSYPDLANHFCGGQCTSSNEAACQQHYTSHGRREIAEGLRAAPTCPGASDCGGVFWKYCNSFPDLANHFCGGQCTSSNEAACRAHYTSSGKAEIAEGRRPFPDCY